MGNFLLEGIERDAFEENNPCYIKEFTLSKLSLPKETWKDCDCGGIVIYSRGEINGTKFEPGFTFITSKTELESKNVRSN